jgi:hypothetical protein
MAGTVMPSPLFVGLDNSGNPLSGGKLHTYSPGGTSNLATYSDAALSSANANPVILDSGGRAPVYLSNTSYKFVLRDSADVLVWTRDNVQSTQVTQVIANEHIPFFGTDEVGDNAEAYPSGATGAVIVPGSKILSLDNANLSGTWQLHAMLRGDGAGTPSITVGLMNVTDADTTALVEVTSTSTVGARVTSGTITFGSGTKSYACKVKASLSANYGYAYGLELVRVA